MSYLGSWKAGDLITFYANTHNASSGSAVDADAVPNYHVYEDETATPLLTGTMALLNGANTVGFYSEQITISGSLGFEKGKSYGIYIQAVVGGVTGTMHHNFQIEAEVDMNTASVPVIAGVVTGSVLGNVNGNVAGTVGAVTGDVGGNVVGNVGGNVVGSVNSVIGNVGGSVGSVVGNVGGNVGGNLLGSVEGDVDGSVTSILNPVVAGVVTGSVLGNVNGSVGSVVSPVGINTGTFLDALADKVWDEPIAGHLAAGSVGNALNAAGAAGDPWSTILPGSYTAAQAGGILASRMPTGTVLVGDKTGFSLSSPQNFNLIGNISGTLSNVVNVVNPVVAGVVTGSVLGNVNGSVASVTNPVGINTGTFFDALADKIWDELLSGHLTVGSAGHTLFSRMPSGTVLVGDKAGFSLSSPQSFHLIGNISGTLSNVVSVINPVVAGVVTGSVLGNVNGSVGSVVSPVGINTGTFLDALADKVWDEPIAGHLSAGSVGNALNAAGSAGDPWATVLPGSYTGNQAGNLLPSRMPTGTVLVGDKTGFSLASPQSFNLIGNISGTITNVLNVVNPVVAGVVTGSVLGNVNGSVNSVTQPVGISTGSFISAIADGVWDEPLAGHLAAGSAGNALNGAGAAGDPWSTLLPGSYTAGQAGGILASRMPTGTVIVGTNNDKTGYSLSGNQNVNIIGNISGTFVGNIQGTISDITTALGNKIADFVLRRNLSSAAASSDGDSVVFRSLLGAARKLVNRWKISGTTLTVYTEDDTTSAGTQALTGTAGADPITEVDTNG